MVVTFISREGSRMLKIMTKVSKLQNFFKTVEVEHPLKDRPVFVCPQYKVGITSPLLHS